MFNKNHFISLISILTLTLSISHAETGINGNLTWDMYQGNAKHTGYVSIHIEPNKITPFLDDGDPTIDLCLTLPAQPIITKNNIIVICNNDYLSMSINAYSLKDGYMEWLKENEGDFGFESPIYYHGHIYLPTSFSWNKGSAYLNVYNDNNGYREKQFTLTNPVSPIINNQILYIANDNLSGIFALDLKTNERIWENEYRADYLKGSKIAVNNKYIIQYSRQNLVKINKFTGKVLSTIKDPNAKPHGPYGATPVLDGDSYAFVSSYHNHLSRFNLETDSIDYIIPETSWDPAVDDKNVYVIQSGFLSVFDKQTGQLKWKKNTSENTDKPIQIIVSDNLIFVSTEYGINAYTKSKELKKVWHTDIPGKMALTKKGLFIATPELGLSAFKVE